MTFEEFRQWALDTSRGAAARWEEPEDDEIHVVLATDDYGAHHVIPMPPIYFTFDRGHVSWLKTLPDIVANRSLRQVAYRTSSWTSSNPKYIDQPVDDPHRGEALLLTCADKGRMEIWLAEIRRSPSRLPSLGDWQLHATQDDGLSGAVPKWLRISMEKGSSHRGPTMPAADMVVGPWDVPSDFVPFAANCGPLDFLKDDTTSSYMAIYRPEEPDLVIPSQALLFPDPDTPREYADGACQALIAIGNTEFEGPPLGERIRYFQGEVDGGRLYSYTALWHYPGAFCEVGLVGPPGRYTKAQLHELASAQDKRARAALE